MTVDLISLQSTHSFYDAHSAAVSTLNHCKSAAASAVLAGQQVQVAENALTHDMSIRTTATAAAHKQITKALGQANKLTGGLKVNQSQRFLSNALKATKKAKGELTKILKLSGELTQQASKALHSAEEEAGRLEGFAVRGKSDSLQVERILQAGDQKDARVMSTLALAGKAASKAAQSAQLAKNFAAEVQGAEKVVDSQFVNPTPPSLAKALIFIGKAEQDGQLAETKIDAPNASHLDWMIMKLQLAQAKRAMEEYETVKDDALKQDSLSLKLISKADKIIGQALKTSKEVQAVSAAAMKALDPTGAINLELKLREKIAKINTVAISSFGVNELTSLVQSTHNPRCRNLQAAFL